MFPTYEAMAESLEQFRFPEYPDGLFIKLADDITQTKDETPVVISSSELTFRKMTYMAMLDTVILPWYLKEICLANFKPVPAYDFGLDKILQNETNIYLNSNLAAFRLIFENIKTSYFLENPEPKSEDKRTTNAIIRRFVEQNLNDNLSRNIVDFISTRVDLRNRISYEINSKQSVHRYWSEILSKSFRSFDGNNLIWDNQYRSWVCADLITVDRSFKQIPAFASLYNHARNDTQWQNVLKAIGTELKNSAPAINSPIYPLFALLVKFHLLDYINNEAASFANQDVISDFKKELRNNYKNIGLPSGSSIRDILYLQETKLRTFKEFPSYQTLIAALYQITEGRKSRLDNIAKLFAKVFLGRKLCNAIGIASPSVTVITTNNLKFLEDFLQSVFTLRLKQDPLMKRDTVSETRNAWYKTNPKNTNYCCSTSTGLEMKNNPGFFTKPKNQLCNPNNGFVDFYVRKCRYNANTVPPVIKDEYDVRNLEKHDVNDYYHISHYNLLELCSEKFIGKFIEDKLYGNLVNVSISQLEDLDPKLNTKQFVSMCKSKSVTSSYDFFKGEQTYSSETHFIFLQDAIEGNDLISEIHPEVIELSQEIPSRAFLFEPKDDFLPHEKLFVAVDMAVYGLNLLMQKNSDPKQLSKPELLNLKDEDVLLGYFFNHCCNTVKIGDDKIPTADNATCPKVLMKGFQSFCNIVSNSSVSPSKIDKNTKDRFLPNVSIFPNNTSEKQMRMKEIAGMKERLDNNGYTADNDGIPKDKTNWWLGIVEKSLDEIEIEAKKLLAEQEELRQQADSSKEKDKPLSPTDFIKLLAKIGNWNIYNGCDNS